MLAQLPDTDPAGILVRPCPDPRFGDYQSVALIALAKERKLNPRLLAEKVVAGLNVAEWCDRVEVAGAGFINFGIRREALTAPLRSAARGEHLFFTRTIDPRTIVVDFSSPNVARRMHVGHIRSTILGDCLARTLTVLGHRVIRDNHVGDWGTQFGKLILGWKTRLDKVALAIDPLAEMERLYKAVNDACEHEPATLEAARQELVKLQNGDAENLKLWQHILIPAVCLKANVQSIIPQRQLLTQNGLIQ